MDRDPNYALLMKRELSTFTEKKTLLLHVCCAPCASQVLERLDPYFHITCYYYNPNISPLDEYDARLAETEKLLRLLPLSETPRLVEGPRDFDRFFELARGREKEPEGGSRCRDCYRLRLASSARYAAENGFDYYTTALTNGPKKPARVIDPLGQELSCGSKWLVSDFKKNGGFDRSVALSEQYGLYRQDYCGCPYSRAASLSGKEGNQNDA